MQVALHHIRCFKCNHLSSLHPPPPAFNHCFWWAQLRVHFSPSSLFPPPFLLPFSQCFPSCAPGDLLFLTEVKLAIYSHTHTHTEAVLLGGGRGHVKSMASCLPAHLHLHLSLCFHFTYELLLQVPPIEPEIDPLLYCLCWLACACLCLWYECCLKHSSEVAAAGVEWDNDTRQQWPANVCVDVAARCSLRGFQAKLNCSLLMPTNTSMIV